MGRPKQLEDGVRVSVVISKKQLAWMQRAAIESSRQNGKQVGVSEAIRAAIEATYPLPKESKQMDLFHS